MFLLDRDEPYIRLIETIGTELGKKELKDIQSVLPKFNQKELTTMTLYKRGEKKKN